jgi:hypothetical protein
MFDTTQPLSLGKPLLKNNGWPEFVAIKNKSSQLIALPSRMAQISSTFQHKENKSQINKHYSPGYQVLIILDPDWKDFVY